jgi:hypothetical protein
MIADRLRNHRQSSAKPASLSQNASAQTGSGMRNSLDESVALNQRPAGFALRNITWLTRIGTIGIFGG